MPQITLNFDTKESIPSALQQYAGEDFKVTLWVGDKVAEETNPALAKNRDDILVEKNNLETKYKTLVESSNKGEVELAKQIADLKIKAESGTKLSDEDQKILDTVKSVKDVQVTPEYLAEATKNYHSVSSELSKLKQGALDSEFFKKTGFKNEKAFLKAISDKEANPNLVKYYSEEISENGKPVQKLFAEYKKADGTTDKVSFFDYVEKHADWSIYKPALVGSEQQNWIPATTNPTSPNTPTTPTGNLPSNSYLDSIQKGFEVANTPKTDPVSAGK